MIFVAASVMALVAAALASVLLTVSPRGLRAMANSCSEIVSLDAKTNVWEKYTLHPNKFYRENVEASAKLIEDPLLKREALTVAGIGTFLWIDTIADIPKIESASTDVPCDHILGLVIHNLPKFSCRPVLFKGDPAAESMRYQTQYIESIAKILKGHPNTAFALVIEPDTLLNVVINADLSSCGQISDLYRKNVAYALEHLNLHNVIMYLDAGHGGLLGWDSNLRPGAAELARAYKAAGSPLQLRGFATNVAGWNSWDAVPGEFAADLDSRWNKAQNEKIYIQLLGDSLKIAGMPNHAIVDTSRNGVQGLRDEWGDWCNVDGAGFGTFPNASTGLELADAFVWVKQGGISDGTSNPNDINYDSFCGKEDAFKTSPDFGLWNHAYFEMLLKNAKPPIYGPGQRLNRERE